MFDSDNCAETVTKSLTILRSAPESQRRLYRSIYRKIMIWSKSMKNLSFIAAAGICASFAVATPASAAVVACSVTDITPTAQACAGFFAGNLISSSPADVTAQTSALATLGFTWDGSTVVETLSGLNGSHTVDFATLLQGISYVAFHFGNGQGGPGNGTAFYRVDAGTGLDVINLAYNASSNARLYSTTPTTAVPEPATWAMMLAGMGLAGAAMRRRKVRTTLSFF